MRRERRLPALILIMRHGAIRPAESPEDLARRPCLRDDQTVSAVADITEAGRALAETLSDLGRVGTGLDRIHIVAEPTHIAGDTARLLLDAYRTAVNHQGYGYAPRAPQLIDFISITKEPVSPYADDVETWLDQTLEELSGYTDGAAVVVVGHDPRMGWLMRSLLGRRSGTAVPGLAHTEIVACFRHRGAFRAEWALSPRDDRTSEALVAKIKSKMGTAKVFAGVLAAALAFIAGSVADLESPARTFGFGGLAALGLATVLYLVTMFRYDRLLMPRRFWPTGLPRRSAINRDVFRRPPSSVTWLMYQNMQRTWSRCFVPATVAAGAGVGVYVMALVVPDSWTWATVSGWGVATVLGAGTVVFLALAIGLARWGRPVLGVQD